jgi:hypothetical protein
MGTSSAGAIDSSLFVLLNENGYEMPSEAITRIYVSWIALNVEFLVQT